MYSLLSVTTFSQVVKHITGGVMVPVNTAGGGISCTLNTRYYDMADSDIISLAHFPRTIILIEYE